MIKSRPPTKKIKVRICLEAGKKLGTTRQIFGQRKALRKLFLFFFLHLKQLKNGGVLQPGKLNANPKRQKVKWNSFVELG